MKLKSKYGNIVEITENRRKIEYLKSLGYTEVEDKPVQQKADNKADKEKNNNTTKRKVKSDE